MEIYHTPVMVKEILSLLEENADTKIVVDGTLGEGGHSELFLKNGYSVFGIDRDEEIALRAKHRLSSYEKFNYAITTYDKTAEVLPSNILGNADMFLIDAGVSLFHFKAAERGFSFSEEDSALDMRLSLNGDKSGEDIVNNSTENQLKQIFFEYGQIPYASLIARAIVKERENNPIKKVKDFENIVFHATPRKFRYGKTHPATRAFQALRIAVNDELSILRVALERAHEVVRIGGVVAVLSYHSLEDKIVKTFFREKDIKRGSGEFESIIKNPLKPSNEEVLANTAARSAKLRASKRIK